MVLALAPETTTFWQVSLVLGAVVIVVVIVLLSLLLYSVRSIEANVQLLSDEAEGVASNTTSIKVALAVIDSLDEVSDEARRHAQLLEVGAR